MNVEEEKGIGKDGMCGVVVWVYFFFFFQAEDGIRDWSVTGVQTCALPICCRNKKWAG